VVGAALAVFGGPMLMGPPPLAPEPASRLASVEASVDDLQALSSTLEPTVQSAVEAAVAEVPSTDGAAIAAVEEELEAVTSAVATLTAAAAEFDPAPVLAEQSDRLAEVGTTLDDLQAQLASEAERLDEARAAAVATLEEQLAGQAELIENARAAASTEVAEAKTALTAELDTMRGTIQSATDTVASLQEQVDALASAEQRAAAAALLARDIDRSMADGSPFVEPLDRLTEMATGNAELDATLSELRPFAESGVPTVQALRQSLEALAETDVTEAIAGYEWLGKTVDNLTDLVAVRATDSDVDVATGDLVAADEALREGDLARAIATVEEAAAIEGGIDPASAEAWLADARARQTAVSAQAQLDTHIRELLTATVN
jgi:DNA repair exonuclease SbcCD ATPase subunit